MILTPEYESLRRRAVEFVDRHIVPYSSSWDSDERVDLSVIKGLGREGLLGTTIDPADGGSGGDNLAYCLILEELGRGDSSVRGIVSVSMGLVAKTIAAHGTSQQRTTWLSALSNGEAIGAFSLTEPQTGSDAASLSMAAERAGDDWLLRGTKTFVANGMWADVAVVFARTGGPGAGGITAFLVPTDVDGVQRTEITGRLGLRGQSMTELVFDAVRVTDSARLGQVGGGFRIAMSALDKGRMSVAAGSVGIASGCLDLATAYAKQRQQFGRPIGSFQLIQQLLADTAVDVAAARLLVWQAAELADRGESFTLEASMAKVFATEAAVRAANNAVQILGAHGVTDNHRVSKYLRDARVSTLYEGTSQIQQLLIGRTLTGLNAFV